MCPPDNRNTNGKAARLMGTRNSRKNLRNQPKGSQAFLFRVFIITLIPVALAGAIFLFLSLYLFLRGTPFLRLKEVTIHGNRTVSADEILAIADFVDHPNILSIDIKTLSRRLGEHPWIEKSMVKRLFPDGIRIVIDERVPVALINLGELYYVDANGVIFDQARDPETTAFPILTGLRREDLEGGGRKTERLLQEALRFLKITHNHKILPYRSISQIHLDRALGLLVYTVGKGTENRMGFDRFDEKFQRLSKIWPAIRSMELSSIDCTIPGRIIIRQKR
jgi:cell division septal protein FtsQ